MHRDSEQAQPFVEAFYDPRTGSVQYVVACPNTAKCAVIDPVLDFERTSGSTFTRNADRILDYIEHRGFQLELAIDTHPHADHFSACDYIRERTGAETMTGSNIVLVQAVWKNIYNLDEIIAMNASWDRLLEPGDIFTLGELEGKAVYSPGHTPASTTLLIGNAAFMHDTLFMPDSGTARTDFPGGDALTLWDSIQEILNLPKTTRLFTGHDYRPNFREPLWESTVEEQRHNIHLLGKTKDEFIAFRKDRDRVLPLPDLMLLALQVNLAGGKLPAIELNGKQYLKVPLNAFKEDNNVHSHPLQSHSYTRNGGSEGRSS